MPTVDHERLRAIKTFPSLVKYLRDELEWPIESEKFDDLTFEYEPEELGLDADTAVKIKEIKQLRPLHTNQPWGIFFINFEPKSLPVVVLRRILRSLVIKKRQSANKAQQATWKLHDLLFISSYGESDHRDITFAHFSEDTDTSDLPALRVLGWDDENTVAHLEHAHKTLKEKLRWPENPSDIDKWRATWSQAFILRNREVITTSKGLAVRMAQLATAIRKRVNKVLAVESERGPLRKLHAAFREALIHDLSEDDFADMYAQTITYGLLSARVSHPTGLVAESITDMVPVTNPFLRDLLSTFLTIGGRKGKIDFDELGINEVVQALRDAKMEAVLRDFGDKNPQEDPVIHFYELFLKEYDPKKRMQRGVFYTPRPVVSFIVRSVDELLRTEFGLADGLADTTSWGEMAKKHSGLKIPKDTKPGDPFVQILDPAIGTGTFIVEVIDVIYKIMIAKWKKQGKAGEAIELLWNQYVAEHLLPRLYGFELMMAPYAIAHMKVGLKLHDTGYHFASHERARIYLTNSLEQAHDFSDRFEFDAPALAHEAHSVNAVKEHKRFTVIVGNPPYSVMSANLSDDAIALVKSFRYLDGQRIVEKGALAHELNLQDDYIKFFGLLTRMLAASGIGLAGYISNFGFLGSRSLRGMRKTLLNSFVRLRFLNLGGHRADRDFSPSTDQNVFEISQGVCISLLSSPPPCPSVCMYGRLTGDRANKYEKLAKGSMSEMTTEQLVPSAPFYKFLPSDAAAGREFLSWVELNSIMPKNSCCIITSRDSLLIDFDEASLLKKIRRFSVLAAGDQSLEKELGYSVKPKWDVEKSKRLLRHDGVMKSRVRKILYRPFDYRLIYYEPHLLDAPARLVCDVIHETENLVLMTPHVKTTERFNHALISRSAGEKKSCSHDRSTQMFPLWDAAGIDGQRVPNIDPRFGGAFQRVIEKPLSPQHILHYIYAIFYSPSYRELYGDALRDSFPRIPVARSSTLAKELVTKGGELTALHLLEDDYENASWVAGSGPLTRPITNVIGPSERLIECAYYADGVVWLDETQTMGFSGVPENVWDFHIGGYQVCEKWLKDRNGRKLSKADIDHYQKIVVALNETIRLMKEIDEVIEKHGGWPDAFSMKEEGSASE